MASNSQAGPTGHEAESQGPIIIALSVVPTVFSCMSVGLRLYTKQKILHSTGPEDYTIVVAQILAVAVAVLNVLGVTLGGMGRHMNTLTKNKIQNYSRIVYAVVLVYNAAQIVTKISFLVQYRRLFPIPNIQKICKYCLAFLVVWGVSQQLFTAFACHPGKFIFPHWERCINSLAVFTTNAVMNMVTDFIVFLIPIQPVLQLRINRKRKMHLLAVFCLGLIACTISVVRLTELLRIYSRPDLTWEMSKTSYLSTIEISIGILCASVPTLRPLVKKIAPCILSSSQNTSNTGRLFSLSMISMPRSRKQKSDTETGIYIQKEVEFHSTTELRHDRPTKDPYSLRGESVDEISIQDIQVTSTATTDRGPPST